MKIIFCIIQKTKWSKYFSLRLQTTKYETQNSYHTIINHLSKKEISLQNRLTSSAQQICRHLIKNILKNAIQTGTLTGLTNESWVAVFWNTDIQWYKATLYIKLEEPKEVFILYDGGESDDFENIQNENRRNLSDNPSKPYISIAQCHAKASCETTFKHGVVRDAFRR